MLFKRDMLSILYKTGAFLFMALVIMSCKPAPVSEPAQESREKPVVFPALDIQGIIYDKDDPIVVINGDVRKVGDVVEGVEVTAITQQYVQLTFEGQNITINVKEPPAEVSQAPKLPEFKVEGIIFDDKSPLVIINGDVKKTGDIVLGAKIIEITRDHVVLEYNDQTIEKKVDVFDSLSQEPPVDSADSGSTPQQ